MIIVLLDSQSLYRKCPGWNDLASLGVLYGYETSTLDELIHRGADASVMLTNRTPLRREVLDYLSRMRLVINLSPDPALVEERIAQDLGIACRHLPPHQTACESIAAAAREVATFLR